MTRLQKNLLNCIEPTVIVFQTILEPIECVSGKTAVVGKCTLIVQNED